MWGNMENIEDKYEMPLEGDAYKKMVKELNSTCTKLVQSGKKRWEYWLIVGKSVMEIRLKAMHDSGTDDLASDHYRQAFNRLLANTKVNDVIDRSGLSKLLFIIENEPDVNGWLYGPDMSERQRQKWTHPATVWKEYKAWLKRQGQPKVNHPKVAAHEPVEFDDTLDDKLGEALHVVHPMEPLNHVGVSVDVDQVVRDIVKVVDGMKLSKKQRAEFFLQLGKQLLALAPKQFDSERDDELG